MIPITRHILSRALTLGLGMSLAVGTLRGGFPVPIGRPPPPRITPSGTVVPDSSAIADTLRSVTQRLMDGVALGDTALWGRYLAPNGLFTDEDGVTRNRRGVLESMHRLPSGFSGSIAVVHPSVIVFEASATITYDAAESETIFGQTLATRYHSTDTYIFRDGRWLMVASQMSVYPSEHRATPVDPSVLEAYVGDYSLAPGIVTTVSREGVHLFTARSTNARDELFPLGVDRFFRKGAPRGEILFRRDFAGRVDGMISRRDNNDLIWRRTVPNPGSR